MVLGPTWPKFIQTLYTWLHRLQVLPKPLLQQALLPQGRQPLQILCLPARHPLLKVPLQQIGQSVHLNLPLDRLMAQRHRRTLTAPPQDLAKALLRFHTRSVLTKPQKEALGVSHLQQATQDLSHQLAIVMIHMPEARDPRKRGILIRLIKDSSSAMCGVVLLLVRAVVLLEPCLARTVAMISKLSIGNRHSQCMA